MAEDRWKALVPTLIELRKSQLKVMLYDLKTSADIALKAQKIWREIAYNIDTSNIIYHIKDVAKQVASCLRSTLVQQDVIDRKEYAFFILGKLQYCEKDNRDCIMHFQSAKNLCKNSSNLHLAFACLKFGDEKAVTCLQQINFEEWTFTQLTDFKKEMELCIRALIYQRAIWNVVYEQGLLSRFAIQLIRVFMANRLQISDRRYQNVSSAHRVIAEQKENQEKYLLLITKIIINMEELGKAINKLDNKSMNLLFFLAEMHFMVGNYKKCIKYCRKILTIQRKHQSCSILLIQCLFIVNEEEDLKNQINDFRVVCSQRLPRSPYGQYYLGRLNQKNGDNNKAKKHYKQSIQICQTKQAMKMLSEIYFEEKNISEAINLMKKCIDIDSLQFFKYKHIIAVLFQQKNVVGVINAFRNGIQANPEDLCGFIQLAKVVKNDEKYRQSANDIVQMLIGRSQSQILHFNASFYYYLVKDKQLGRQYQKYLADFFSKPEEKSLNKLYQNIIHSIMVINNIDEVELQVGIEAANSNFSLLYMGVLSSINGNIKASAQYFKQILKNYKKEKESLVTVFEAVYLNLIAKTSQTSQPIYIQYLLTQLLNVDIVCAIECYYKSKSYCQCNFSQFRKQVQAMKMINFECFTNSLNRIIRISFSQNMQKEQIPLDLKYFHMFSFNYSSQHIEFQLLKSFQYAQNVVESVCEYLLPNKFKISNNDPFCQLAHEIQSQQQFLIEKIKNQENQTLSFLIQKYFAPYFKQNYAKDMVLMLVHQLIYKCLIQKQDIQMKIVRICKGIQIQQNCDFKDLLNELQEALELTNKEETNSTISNFYKQISEGNSSAIFENEIFTQSKMIGLNYQQVGQKVNNLCFEIDKLNILLYSNQESSSIGVQIDSSYESSSIIDQYRAILGHIIHNNTFEEFPGAYEQYLIKGDFYKKPEYRHIQPILFQNNCLLIYYLCMHRQQLKFVAKYDTYNEIYPDKKFQFKSELGKPYKFWKQALDLGLVLNWIINIARAIEQIESIGIYNPDIQFRNTILIEKDGPVIFKMIDFDYAFASKKSFKFPWMWKVTEKLLTILLQFQKQPTELIQYIFLAANQDIKRKLLDIKVSDKLTLRQKLDICQQLLERKLLDIKVSDKLTLRQKLDICQQLLEQHMVEHHFKQFCIFVKELLFQQMAKKYLKYEQYQLILERLEDLSISKQYSIFAQAIEKIKNTVQTEQT